VQGGAVSADAETAASFPKYLAKIFDEVGCIKPQISRVDETVLYWKKIGI
jgi:hypothetical protein